MNLPNQLSVLRICLTPVYLYLLSLPAHTSKRLSFAVFILAALTDYYDGYVARKLGHVTKWGQFLDPLADKVMVIAGYFTFACMGYYPIFLVWIILFRDVVITLLRLMTARQRRMIKTLLLAKLKTFGQFVLLLVVYLFHLSTWHLSADQYNLITSWIYHSNFILYATYSVTGITVLSGIIYIVNIILSKRTEKRLS